MGVIIVMNKTSARLSPKERHLYSFKCPFHRKRRYLHNDLAIGIEKYTALRSRDVINMFHVIVVVLSQYVPF